LFDYAAPRVIYPTNSIAEIVRNPIQSGSSAAFIRAPVNTKEAIEIKIYDLDSNEFALTYSLEVVIYEKNAILSLDSFRFMEFHKIRNLKVSLNDRPVTLSVKEEEGSKWYYFPKTEYHGDGQRNNLEVSYVATRIYNSSGLLPVPFYFNQQRYSRIAHIPVVSIPVSEGNRSDLVTTVVSLESLFYRLLPANSGWTAEYLPSPEDWHKYVIDIKNFSPVFQVPSFEFPIDQTTKPAQRICRFITTFSSSNIASRFTLLFIPDWPIYLFVSCFLWCVYPFLIGPLSKMSTFQKVIGSYATPVSLVVGTDLLSDKRLLLTISELMRLLRPEMLMILAIYPFVFFYAENVVLKPIKGLCRWIWSSCFRLMNTIQKMRKSHKRLMGAVLVVALALTFALSLPAPKRALSQSDIQVAVHVDSREGVLTVRTFVRDAGQSEGHVASVSCKLDKAALVDGSLVKLNKIAKVTFDRTIGPGKCDQFLIRFSQIPSIQLSRVSLLVRVQLSEFKGVFDLEGDFEVHESLLSAIEPAGTQ